MPSMIQVSGVAELKKAIRNADVNMSRGFRRGLAKAGLILQRESQKIVPIATGNLKGSAGTELEGQGWNSDAAVFYTAEYALYVHERTDLTHAPGKQAKFLEQPMKEQRDHMLKVIAREIRGGGRASHAGLPTPHAPLVGNEQSGSQTRRRWSNQYGSGWTGGE